MIIILKCLILIFSENMISISFKFNTDCGTICEINAHAEYLRIFVRGNIKFIQKQTGRYSFSNKILVQLNNITINFRAFTIHFVNQEATNIIEDESAYSFTKALKWNAGTSVTISRKRRCCTLL